MCCEAVDGLQGRDSVTISPIKRSRAMYGKAVRVPRINVVSINLGKSVMILCNQEPAASLDGPQPFPNWRRSHEPFTPMRAGDNGTVRALPVRNWTVPLIFSEAVPSPHLIRPPNGWQPNSQTSSAFENSRLMEES